MKLKDVNSSLKYYAGIGARNTPDNILDLFSKIAFNLNNESDTYILRSGHAVGADTAFETGSFEECEIFTANDATPKAIEYASHFHNNWNNCTNYVKHLHGRNAMIILGKNLDTPVKFVLCWTHNGKDVGGTGLSMRIAKFNNIPIYNLFYKDIYSRFVNYVNKVDDFL